MALTPPNKNWNKVPIGKDEKLWALLIVIMISMMGFMTVGYLFFGHQNPPEEYHRYKVDSEFVKKYPEEDIVRDYFTLKSIETIV